MLAREVVQATPGPIPAGEADKVIDEEVWQERHAMASKPGAVHARESLQQPPGQRPVHAAGAGAPG